MGGEQPMGTVTHLFTDIEDSTKLWELFPEGMQAALIRHDAVLREAIAAHRGHLVKTTGDGFHAVFAVPSDALDAAIAAQRALDLETWAGCAIRVRMGLHTGAAEEREGDYYGPVLNRAARLLSAGHGGQILVTRATRELVRDQSPEGVKLLDVGKCLLKGLARPEHVFQVTAPGILADFPPLRALEYRPNNLPVPTTPFIGRERELAQLAHLLSTPEIRLVTILGAGGIGKTRLALEQGERILHRAQPSSFTHGVFFVPLAPVDSVENIVSAVAQAVNLSFHEGREPRQQMLDYVREKQLLLILDNFDDLLDGVTWVADVLMAAPAVKILSTSRTALNIQGEQLYRLYGMELPDWGMPAHPPAYSAVRLFMQSAQRVRPGLELTRDELDDVVRICRLVAGTPLAILLAAAWMEMLSPGEILAEIQCNLDFLETDLQDVAERQRSMRAVFDYSWGQLDERERQVFRGLSVFRGGFARQAAQSVTGATLRELRGLVNKPLLHRTSTGRYEIHELLRQYGLEKLAQLGELAALRQRHLDYHLSLAGQGEALSGQQWVDWLHCLTADIGNLRAALDWCLQSGDARAGLRLALYLRSVWGNLGYLSERRDWLARLLTAAPEPTPERARGLAALGQTAHAQGDYAEALAHCEESLALSEATGDMPAIADATFYLAWPAAALGDLARSYALLERSMKLYQGLDNPQRAAFVLLVMGELARAEGDLARARELHKHSVALHRTLPSQTRLAIALANLGCVLIHFGELDRSQELLAESIDIVLGLGGTIEHQLMGSAFLANARGQALRAAWLLAASDALRETSGQHVDVGDRLDYERALIALRAQLGEGAFEAVWSKGQAMTPQQAIVLALSDGPV